jgi:hypothetical protein
MLTVNKSDFIMGLFKRCPMHNQNLEHEFHIYISGQVTLTIFPSQTSAS